MPPPGDKAAWKARNVKIGAMWNGLSDDEKAVFKDPLFFALAGIPDPFECYYSEEKQDGDAEDGEVAEANAEAADPELADSRERVLVAPQVHQLTPAQSTKYQPHFKRLVDIKRVELNYAKPEKSESSKSIMKKSLARVRAGHSNVCPPFFVPTAMLNAY